MRSVSGSKATHSHVLIAQAGSVLCAIPIAHVVETMRPLPIEPIGHAPSGVRGLALIRGEPTPVLDATLVCGGARGDATATRFVVVRAGARRIALAFDAVIDVRWIADDQLAALPPLVASAGRDVVAALGRADAALLIVLEVARAIDAPAWQQLEAAVAAAAGAPGVAG